MEIFAVDSPEEVDALPMSAGYLARSMTFQAMSHWQSPQVPLSRPFYGQSSHFHLGSDTAKIHLEKFIRWNQFAEIFIRLGGLENEDAPLRLVTEPFFSRVAPNHDPLFGHWDFGFQHVGKILSLLTPLGLPTIMISQNRINNPQVRAQTIRLAQYLQRNGVPVIVGWQLWVGADSTEGPDSWAVAADECSLAGVEAGLSEVGFRYSRLVGDRPGSSARASEERGWVREVVFPELRKILLDDGVDFCWWDGNADEPVRSGRVMRLNLPGLARAYDGG